MNHRFLRPLVWLAALLAITPLLLQSAHATAATGQPNIIVVLADDLGYSDLGCYGGEIDTPHIDSLAAGGAKFTQVYNSARCCPSRASLMTGLYPTQAGIGDFTTNRPDKNRGAGYLGRLREDCVTMAEVLKPAGYGCYYVGKWHLHPETGPIQRGFDEFYGYTEGHSHDQYDADYYIRLPAGKTKEIDPSADQYYATDVFNEYALEFIRQGQESDRPWFLFLGHSSPHFPVQSPPERADKYDAIYQRGWDVLREERYERMQKLGIVDGESWTLPPRSIVPVDRDDIANGFPGEQNPAWDSLDADRQADLARRMAVFAAMVEGVDTGVGRMVDHLKQTGELDNTLILFLSDNGACYEWGPFGFDGVSRRGETILRTGEELREIGGRGTHQSYGSGWANLGNTPLRMYKHFTHEGGISTPFIAHWPAGIGKRNDWVRQPAHMMDVLPTLMDAAGAEYPARYNGNEIQPREGTSLLPAMRGEKLPQRTIGFDHQAAHALRDGDWKIVYSKRMPEELTWELYNLAEDRCETTDLAEREPERLEAMIDAWEEWATRVGVTWADYDQSKQAASTQAIEFPQIAQCVLELHAEVRSAAPAGVVMAQGGNQHGYAIHFVDGHPAFDVRIDGQVQRLMSEIQVKGRVKLDATLTAYAMTLAVNGGEPITAPSPGLIPAQPIDGLSVGWDDQSAAGDYQSPNAFRGKVLAHSVKAKTEDASNPPVANDGDRFNPAFVQEPSDRTPGPVMDGDTIRRGLKSHDRALYIKSGWIRDPYITLGPDDYYYLTGTQPNENDPREAKDPYNIGLGNESIVGNQVRVYRSKDLIDWESLGAVFTTDDLHPSNQRTKKAKRIWAPEVHWMGDRWALVHCPAYLSSLATSEESELAGPWAHPMKSNMGRRHDPSLFTDDDETVYLLWQNTLVAPLSRGLNEYTAEPVRIDPAGTRPSPAGKPISRIGHEGATMIKIGDKYVHFGTAWSTDQGRQGSYNLYYSVADDITGPYGPRQFAGRFLGHGTPFQTKDGKWWCTAFFNGNVPPLPREGIESRDLSENAQTINEQGVTIVPLDIRVRDNGDVFIRAKDPAYANPGPDEAQEFSRI
ncbi:sulfatase-like hydrolase/transferase [Allorhodopirellula solitaria]|uniref:Arylsulfatase n=1 Tax=Allorhodopirellula solitaria TaxID=2527987 RepID=A0A5C5YGS3_9BACT|nr:sulfatase-like hydrolase/transferase [Allorhodopirellula solitaria]TWT74239.1 Arylsulfatase [Allorhodopirellula solitaria]